MHTRQNKTHLWMSDSDWWAPEGVHGRQVLRVKRGTGASTGAGIEVYGEPLEHFPRAERHRDTYPLIISKNVMLPATTKPHYK